MFPKYSSFVLLLGIIEIISGLRQDYFNCPKDTDAKKEVANIVRNVPAKTLGHVKLSIRVPEHGGFLPAPITCIVVTDLSSSGNGGTVDVNEGGFGSKFAVIKIVSKFFKGLNYRIQVWTA